MPKAPTIHYNPPTTEGRSTGRQTRNGPGKPLQWTTDPKDATCDSCVKLARKDGLL